jgi:hypothetical protein
MFDIRSWLSRSRSRSISYRAISLPESSAYQGCRPGHSCEDAAPGAQQGYLCHRFLHRRMSSGNTVFSRKAKNHTRSASIIRFSAFAATCSAVAEPSIASGSIPAEDDVQLLEPNRSLIRGQSGIDRGNDPSRVFISAL